MTAAQPSPLTRSPLLPPLTDFKCQGFVFRLSTFRPLVGLRENASKFFPCHTSEKSARNSFLCHTSKSKGLKALSLPHIQKKRGWGGIYVNQFEGGVIVNPNASLSGEARAPKSSYGSRATSHEPRVPSLWQCHCERHCKPVRRCQGVQASLFTSHQSRLSSVWF